MHWRFSGWRKTCMKNSWKRFRPSWKKMVLLKSPASHHRLTELMGTAEKDSFTSMFWEEQKKAFASKKGGMRWHPMMIRFAILIHSQSPSTYRTLREAGAVRLPAESTLRDYTNVLHPQTGFGPQCVSGVEEGSRTTVRKWALGCSTTRWNQHKRRSGVWQGNWWTGRICKPIWVEWHNRRRKSSCYTCPDLYGSWCDIQHKDEPGILSHCDGNKWPDHAMVLAGCRIAGNSL